MKKQRSNPGRPVDRLSLLWLALALGLSLFAVNGRWDIALAAWLFPVFLLRFARTQNPVVGFLGAWFVSTAAFLFWYWQTLSSLSVFFIGIGVIAAAFQALPYLLDRIFSFRLRGFLSTLIFPLASVLIDYLKTQVSPLGSIGSIA